MITDRGAQRWVDLEIHLLARYVAYWEQRTRAQWLLRFNEELAIVLITFYQIKGLPYRPPTFKPWYIKLCHDYYRWRSK